MKHMEETVGATGLMLCDRDEAVIPVPNSAVKKTQDSGKSVFSLVRGGVG